jgi:hypothetical protein
MTTITCATTAVQPPFDSGEFDEAELAAVSFLARYSGRTLEAYRHDLRGFFQGAADHDVPVLAATRPHIELWRGSMEERGLAASTIGRRLSTVCGSTGSLTSTAASAPTPPSTSAGHRSTPPMHEGSIDLSSACSSPPPTTTTATTRHLQSCSA